MATVFIGFRYEGTIRGCTAEISWDEYIGRRENVLDIIEHTPVDHARTIFECIEWETGTNVRDKVGGSILTELLVNGIESFAKNHQEVVTFLGAELGESSPLLDNFRMRVAQSHGQTVIRLVDDTPHFYENGSDMSFIFDLDADENEI
ncbi:hypothetical protein [Alicyclobacillus mengziensis]|uniref:Uncharacterized protein n=1 Tax=Alicyclobacillus mengziensis TaxID=2931921 RepID=A0A9X7W1Q9_9BACL|nr:hypothetical protein [Alicyclobacillus mengziensis]QSO48645.1 hypothetical protein JZ786_06660 [Alicyclobacillus mengziensis]